MIQARNTGLASAPGPFIENVTAIAATLPEPGLWTAEEWANTQEAVAEEARQRDPKPCVYDETPEEALARFAGLENPPVWEEMTAEQRAAAAADIVGDEAAEAEAMRKWDEENPVEVPRDDDVRGTAGPVPNADRV